MSFAALILAGGASSRMGRPKALLTLDGECFADRLIDVFSRHCSPVVVVLGYDADRVRAGIRRQATFVVNSAPEQGQLSSLQCGLRDLAGDLDGFLFTPVDHPRIQAGTIARLLDRAPGMPVVVPRYNGRRGHPVCCSRALREEFLTLPEDGQPRDVIRRHLLEGCQLDVDDPGVIEVVNYPEDYDRMLTAAKGER